jgi:hypothetical protein
VLLLAADGGRNALARKLNDKSSADTADSDIDFRQTVITPRPLTERVFYNPNRGELGKVEDYVANVYIGDIYFAFADPVGAGVGSGVRRCSLGPCSSCTYAKLKHAGAVYQCIASSVCNHADMKGCTCSRWVFMLLSAV